MLAPARPDMTDIIDLDATDISRALSTRDLSSVEVMTAVLERIEAVNPQVNAIVSLRPRETLLAEAKSADARRARGELRGWLHGIPFAIKDLCETAGLRTTYGSPIFADHIPQADDLLARRIKAAGAIVIGKTNTPEFGLGSHSYNPVHGVTRNPYDLSRSAGGSSGGAAAAIAARMVPVADGSDMMGSLRNPAAFCNVYGMRPTYGRVPGDTIGDTFLNQLATDGPMARSVRDLARLLDTLSGPEPHVPHALPQHASFADNLDAPVEGKRIGWLGDWGGHLPLEHGILGLCADGLAILGDLGLKVEPVTPPFDAARLWTAWTVLRSFAVSNSLRPHYDDPARRALLKPEAIFEVESGLSLTPAEIYDASVVRSQWFAAAADLFEQYDALVLPSVQLFPFPAEWTWPDAIADRPMQTYHRWMEVVIPASIAGLPALNVPVGFFEGRPMGMQLIGRRGDDLGLLRIGQAYHHTTDWPGRIRPIV